MELEPVVAAPALPPLWQHHELPTPVVADEPEPIAEEAEPVAAQPEPAPAPVAFTPDLVPSDEVEAEAMEAEPIVSAPEEPAFEEPPPPHVILPRKKPTIFKEPKPDLEAKPVAEKRPLAKQEVMQFEPVTRGRFEKSEPTIVEGQDLDVPTFLRKNVRVK